jgi:amino acid transporter
MPWILWAILVLVIILAVVAFLAKKRKKRPIDYYTWFIIGFSWMILGIALNEYVFSIIGVVFMVFALRHRKDWQKHVNWSDKNITRWIVWALAAFVVAALVAGIISFFMNS